MVHCENAYHIPNLNVVGYVCKTNLPSNTAFRSFGRPQSMYMMECIISNVAAVCNIPVHKVCVIPSRIDNPASYIYYILNRLENRIFIVKETEYLSIKS